MKVELSSEKIAKWTMSKRIVFWMCLLPLLFLVATWFGFPIFEKVGLGYSILRTSCIFAIVISGVGVLMSVIESQFRSMVRTIFHILAFILIAGAGVMAVFYGDFYWTFNRGYFLD